MASEAVSYLDLATRAALTIGPFLVAMTGLSGTGKSTVAEALAEATGATIHASDAVRKELAADTGETAAQWGKGIYSGDWTDRTYRRLGELAARDLAAGKPVILDATFLDPDRRNDVACIGREAGVPTLFIETVCDEETVAARLAARAARGDSVSDATLETYRRQRELIATTPPTFPEGVTAVTVDTTESNPGLLDPVLAALIETGAIVPRIPESTLPIFAKIDCRTS
jgi:predicted kinase